MKKAITLLAIMALAATARGDEPFNIGMAMMRYCYEQDGTNPVPEAVTLWRVTSDVNTGADTNLWPDLIKPRIRLWNGPGAKPDVDTLRTNWTAAVQTWAADWKANQRADYDQWSPRERKLITLMVQEINVLRVNAGLAPRTAEQVKAALKAMNGD